jgi:hypothetical protein
MASNIGDFRTKVGNRIKDAAAKLVQADVDAAIVGALEEYSKARPRERVILLTGTGAFDYLASGLTGFVDGFAPGGVRSIVYPWDATTPTPTFLDSDQFGLIRLVAGLTLRFLSARPTAAQQFLVTYTTPHTVDVSTSSVSVADDETLSDLAACYACEALAGFYSQSTDGSISADSVDHRSKADMYRSQAKRWRDAYAAKMQGDDADEAAFAVSDVPVGSFSNRPADRLFFHGSR